VGGTDEDEEQQTKAAKKAAANRKKKDRKKAKKAAVQQQQLLVSQAEAEPELHTEPEPELQADPEPAPDPEIDADAEAEAGPDPEVDAENLEPILDERTQQLQALTELRVHQWSAAQVLEWVALADWPPESGSVVTTVIKELALDDGEDFLLLPPKTLQKKLAKHGAQDAEALAKQVMQQRDALLPGDNTAAASTVLEHHQQQRSNSPECPICMELFSDDASGQCVPRILTGCGHTVCHGCITQLLSQGPAVKKNKKKNAGTKDCKCPSCEAVTEVEGGDASNLFRNYALVSAAEEAV